MAKKRISKRHGWIFISLFMLWGFILIFNASTQAISNFVKLDLMLFSSIFALALLGTAFYGIWLADRGKF